VLKSSKQATIGPTPTVCRQITYSVID